MSSSTAHLNDFLWPQLQALPAFRALIRAMEARLFAELGPLPRPMLDIGSGNGHFAQSIWEQLDVGIDPDDPDLSHVMSKVHRVLRPSGHFVFSVPTYSRANLLVAGSSGRGDHVLH